ncbi:hypothetical protein BDF21DRAFT_398476 [Thamnidium elegans]|nr:hypothetical protein BDF21DRAFT_398476 [Thamnidium elegans]
MFGNNTSKKNEGISKKKPGPKIGSKRNPHANRPDSKRLMDQSRLQQQQLDEKEGCIYIKGVIQLAILIVDFDVLYRNNNEDEEGYIAIIENEDAEEGTENYDEYIRNFIFDEGIGGSASGDSFVGIYLVTTTIRILAPNGLSSAVLAPPIKKREETFVKFVIGMIVAKSVR